MIKKTLSLFTYFLIISCYCNAEIIESNTLSSVLNYPMTPQTLVIFDIDNTIARPAEELSSDEWFCHKINQRLLQGYDYITSVYYTLPAVYYAHFNVPIKLIENSTAELIANLINTNIPVMALSTRSLFIAERTIELLNNIGIYFYIPGVNPQDYVLPMPYPCFYSQGILFAGNNDKGETLIRFFNDMNYFPEAVIFIDDKMKYLLSVEKALQKHNITFYGIRYSRCDDYVNNFDPKKADAQYYTLREKNKIVDP